MNKVNKLATAQTHLGSSDDAHYSGVSLGGALAFLGVIAVVVILTFGGYESAVNFTSGAIEGFVNGLE